MLGALLSTVGGALLGHGLAKDRQENAQDFSAQQFATRYQTTVQDMKSAGLNPMLAYSQGGGSPPSSSAASAQSVDTGQAYLQSKMNSAQVANIEADTANKQAQADLIQAQISQTTASANQSNAQVSLINANVDKVREEIKNIPTEGKRLYEAAKMLYEQSNLLAAQGKSEQFRQDVLRQTASKLISETDLLKLDIDAAKSLGNIGREFGQLKPVIDVLLQLISMGRPRGGGIVINK
jgi:hypothetical protein